MTIRDAMNQAMRELGASEGEIAKLTKVADDLVGLQCAQASLAEIRPEHARHVIDHFKATYLKTLAMTDKDIVNEFREIKDEANRQAGSN